jgi:hypothetical protein
MSLQAFRSLVGRSRAGLFLPTRLTGTSRIHLNQQRPMGGGGGYPEGKIPQSMEAKLFGGPSKPEGWETDIYITYTLATVLWFVFLYLTPDTSLSTWARGEAAARLRLKEEHGFDKFEFGVHYNTPRIYEEGWEKLAMKVRMVSSTIECFLIH